MKDPSARYRLLLVSSDAVYDLPSFSTARLGGIDASCVFPGEMLVWLDILVRAALVCMVLLVPSASAMQRGSPEWSERLLGSIGLDGRPSGSDSLPADSLRVLAGPSFLCPEQFVTCFLVFPEYLAGASTAEPDSLRSMEEVRQLGAADQHRPLGFLTNVTAYRHAG